LRALRLRNLISFAAALLKNVDKFHLSFDRSYREAITKLEAELEGREVYEFSRSLVNKFYLLEHISEITFGEKSYEKIALTWLALYGERFFKQPFPGLRDFSTKIIETYSRVLNERKLHLSYSFPEWFIKELEIVFDREELEKLLKSLNEEVIWARINTLKTDEDKALKELDKQRISFERDKDISYLVKLIEFPRPTGKISLFKEGKLILQDKASVLAVEALRPEPGELICDVCAAPGIKTSLIAQLTENKARILAIDVSKRRINQMKALMRRYGAKNIELAISDSRKMRLRRKSDKVLLDSPCSASGAIGRDPAIKVHLRRRGRINYYAQLQRSLLSNCLNLGREVIYVTCSILPQEGEEVVLSVLNESSAKLVDLDLPCSNGYSLYPRSYLFKRTFPHVHECEAFFYAKLLVN